MCDLFSSYSYPKLCINFYYISENNLKYKFWVYYFGSPKFIDKDSPLSLGTSL